MSDIKVTADLKPAMTVTKTLGALEKTLNEANYLNSMTRSAFDIMEGQFNWDTAAISTAQPENFHHIYEPEHIGEPPFQLFQVKMKGRSGSRVISWDWKASKLTVPTDVGPTGKDRWAGAGPEFDPSKLNRIHVFVWKAPVMEYGITVTVRPKLSRYLVFPANEVMGGKTTPVFTKNSYSFTPGKLVHGNFTAWFEKWWAGGMADQSLKGWKAGRDITFKRSFEQRLARASRGGKVAPNISALNTESAAQGAYVARMIAGDLKRYYINDAKKRKKGVTAPNEE